MEGIPPRGTIPQMKITCSLKRAIRLFPMTETKRCYALYGALVGMEGIPRGQHSPDKIYKHSEAHFVIIRPRLNAVIPRGQHSSDHSLQALSARLAPRRSKLRARTFCPAYKEGGTVANNQIARVRTEVHEFSAILTENLLQSHHSTEQHKVHYKHSY
jgi:hypothetical protein